MPKYKIRLPYRATGKAKDTEGNDIIHTGKKGAMLLTPRYATPQQTRIVEAIHVGSEGRVAAASRIDNILR